MYLQDHPVNRAGQRLRPLSLRRTKLWHFSTVQSVCCRHGTERQGAPAPDALHVPHGGPCPLRFRVEVAGGVRAFREGLTLVYQTRSLKLLVFLFRWFCWRGGYGGVSKFPRNAPPLAHPGISSRLKAGRSGQLVPFLIRQNIFGTSAPSLLSKCPLFYHLFQYTDCGG